MDDRITDRVIEIYSDSKEAIKALGNMRITSHDTDRCIQNLDRLASLNTSVNLKWIPKKHCDHRHAKADSLAKTGLEKPVCDIDVRPNKDSLEKLIKIAMKNEITLAWDSETIKHTKNMMTGPFDERFQNLPKYSKKELRIIVAIITGHAPLNEKLHQMNLRGDPMCDHCGNKLESMEHFLTECTKPIRFAARKKTFGAGKIIIDRLKYLPLNALLAFSRKSGLWDHV